MITLATNNDKHLRGETFSDFFFLMSADVSIIVYRFYRQFSRRENKYIRNKHTVEIIQ